MAEATRDLAQVTYQRFQDLFQRNVIAAQDFDTAADNYGQDQATVIANQANVNRLQALEEFKIVRAPFDGIVTARNTDIGAFIPLGSGTQLFRMARISPLRVYVDVPESFTEFVNVGAAADNYGQDQATVIADQANVNRLQALEEFKIVRAPFDGIVTARNTDIGAYIPLGSGTQLFRMARISPLRVYVDVPESFTEFVKVGAAADLTVGRFLGRKFPARVVGTAGAINPTAKRLLTELEVPNQTGELFPGAYVQVTLKIPGNKGDLTIPAGTLLFTSGKPAVGVVRPNGTVEIRKIVISRDLGSRLEISQGLSESDQIITSPPPGLAEGTAVIIAKPT